MEDRRNGQEVPRPGGSAGPLGILRRWDLRGEGGGQGLPPSISEKRCFLRVSGHPGRCFRRVPPEPPGPNKTCSGPPGTEGLRAFSFSRTCRKWWQVCEIRFSLFSLPRSVLLRSAVQSSLSIPPPSAGPSFPFLQGGLSTGDQEGRSRWAGRGKESPSAFPTMWTCGRYVARHEGP